MLALDEWYLMTFVFEDNVAVGSQHPNGIRFRMYVNDFMYQENSASDTVGLRGDVLRQNEGDMIFFPHTSSSTPAMMLGNPSYHARALGVTDIASVFRRGPPKKETKDLSSEAQNLAAARPAHLTAYNKADIYNY